ncbi:hypothetical protein [Mucilaginibacter aquaedulcis]|uniref:hypothetical protein n=1 Tax=Mucilaginibacter aquaedulcis TaxID=1187081 RepID=UPI0025B284A1|nr:hypothetical protein [Mucilaginibacter aquaedulcis]MDN3549218.1 hypothetical protein [Mucilaginibacter aquaedulcis]
MTHLQRSGLIYLYLVPPAVAALGFGIGQVNISLYLSLWVVNICLMSAAIWQLIKRPSNLAEKKSDGWTNGALLLIIPWMLFSMFAGMGRPPTTIAGWVATATEQQARFTILIIGGISGFMGFALLKVKLNDQSERLYSTLGFAALTVAIPFFLLNMTFWGFYLTDAFRYFITLPPGKRPEWYPPIRTFFYVISVIEVALIYLTTILFAIALKKTNILSDRSGRWYIIMASIGLVLGVLPPSSPEPFSTAAYLSAVPAIPFIMPYLIGVRLLRYNKN